MKKIVLTLNQMFTYIAIGIVHVPFIIFYILMSPVLFLTWALGYWSKAVRWAENG